MGTTCSSPKHQEVEVRTINSGVTLAASKHQEVKVPTINSGVTPAEHSGAALSKAHSIDPLDRFPPDLVILLFKETNPITRPPHNMPFVSQTVGRSDLQDTEVLTIYRVLSPVMDQDTRIKAARNLNDRGYPNEALVCLQAATSDDVPSLVADIQKVRLHRWSRPDGEFVEYNKFWGTTDLSGPIQICHASLANLLQRIGRVFPDPVGKFGIKGMLDDKPHSSSLSLSWNRVGNFNFEEQNKSCNLFMTSFAAPKRPRIQNVQLHPTPESSAIFPRRLYSRNACRVPGVRFIKVGALLTLKSGQPLSSLPADAYTDIGQFAVSHGRGDGSMLQRLQRVLKTVDGILPTDGVFINCSCDLSERLAATLFAKSIFEQCHAIFLPTPDFFGQARCMLECMAWFLSPFPNQALGDFALAESLIVMSMTNFGNPPFYLDRPQLQHFGKIAMDTTDDDKFKEFFSTMLINDNCFNSTRLRESLTKLVFKLESTIMV